MLMGSTLSRLDALSQSRSLTDEEVQRLERAVYRSSTESVYRHWTGSDDRRLVRYLNRGKKPALIASLMNRTERAIWRRMNILGLGVRKCAGGKCSIAPRGRK